MNQERISDKFNYPSKFVEIDGANMHYIEAGHGDVILFLHSIPMSSYTWRNVIPHLSELGRCIAPDLIGFGKSAKPDIAYSIVDHIKFLDQFIAKLNLRKITLVMHGWGSVMGFDYAMRNEKNCKGLAFYEAFLRSLDNEDLSLPFHEQLSSLENMDQAADRVACGVAFIDHIMPQNVMRQLSDEEMSYYRQPFMTEGSSKPILQYLKELPRGTGESTADKIIANYSKKLTESTLPKLMLYSVPGFITSIATIMWAKEHLKNLEIIDIGEELHLAQESYPKLMSETISVWFQGLQ